MGDHCAVAGLQAGKGEIVEQMGELLEEAGMRDVLPLPKARVPVVKFVVADTSTKVRFASAQHRCLSALLGVFLHCWELWVLIRQTSSTRLQSMLYPCNKGSSSSKHAADISWLSNSSTFSDLKSAVFTDCERQHGQAAFMPSPASAHVKTEITLCIDCLVYWKNCPSIELSLFRVPTAAQMQ